MPKQLSAQTESSYAFYALCGILMLASELWKQWTLTFAIGGGSYNWWHFPFQLCSIPMYACLCIGILSSPRLRTRMPYIRDRASRISSLLMAFLMDFGLLGGVFAFFDTSGMHYGYLPLTIHSYAWHILLIFIGCRSGLGKGSEQSLKGFRFSVLLYLACCVIATILNLAFSRFGLINMFYISPRCDMQQKVFCQIAEKFGNACGIAAYILASVTGAALFHLFWNRLAKWNAPISHRQILPYPPERQDEPPR